MNHLLDEVQQASPTVTLAPVEKLGGPELLRIAAAFAPYLSASVGLQLAAAANRMGVTPATVTAEDLAQPQGDDGALALIEGQVFAFGRLRYLRAVEVAPHQAEVSAGERLERAGYAAYYVISLTHFHCLGIVGVRLFADTAS